MSRTNEATDTDLKVVERLQQLGRKRGDTLLYQQEYTLSPNQQKIFDGRKRIKPNIILTDINGNIMAIFENKFDNEKKALTKLLIFYVCSHDRTIFYDTECKGLEYGEFRPATDFITLKDLLVAIRQDKIRHLNVR